MSSKSVAERLDRVERKPLKCELRRTSEVFVRGGDIFEQARNAAQMTREQAADAYGVSASLLQRQVTNQDNQHLSFQRICEMPERFQVEVVKAWVQRLDGVQTRTVIEIDDRKTA